MNKIWIIVQREYITRVKRRAFIITTLLAPLGFLLLMTSSVLISSYSHGRTDVAIVDETGLFKDIPIPDAEDQSVYFHKVDERYEQVAQLIPREKERETKYQAIMYIPSDFDINWPDKHPVAYRYVQRPGLSKKDFITHRMSAAIQKLRMKMLHVNNDELDRLQQDVKINFESLDDTHEKQGYTEVASVAGLIM